MYYYIKEQNGETAICSGNRLPKNMDGVTLITYEEYQEEHKKRLEELARLEAELAAEQPEEEVNE
jgi:hypothetical protein